MGDAAGAAERARRRGVRRDGGGRPPEIDGIEQMVGLFINTLPLRIKLAAGKPLIDLLREVQESQSRLMAHQHVGLAEIQAAAG